MKKVLVIAPHPDDEILGCGGTLSRLKKKKLYWMIVTKMTNKIGYTNNQIYLREKEINKISKSLNIVKKIELGFPASSLSKINLKELISKMSIEINKIKPDTIFAPYQHDAHSDHFFTTYTLNHILKAFRYPFLKRCYLYETLSETNQSFVKKNVFKPNTYFDISKNLKKKLKMASVYKSEIKKHPFPRSLKSIEALAILRGSESGFKYAEAFKLIIQKND
tara:strand:+ start:170 stop:832 length:663 start_codon:yes stop_codon:yes gene_type:complete